MGDMIAKLLYRDENSVKPVNSQQMRLWFSLINNVQRTVRNFIFYADGYYYSATSDEQLSAAKAY
jgi:hypothetical protein